MARNFNGSTDKLTATESAVNAVPATLFAWCNPSTVSAAQKFILSVSDSADNDPLLNITNGNATTNKFQAQFRGNGGTSASDAKGTTTPIVGQWYAICGTYSSTGIAKIYVNGTLEGTGSSPTGGTDISLVNRTTVGVLTRLSDSLFFAGDIAEVAIWNSEISNAEILKLAKGYCPGEIATDHLKMYCPMLGEGSGALEWSQTRGRLWKFSGTNSRRSAHAPLVRRMRYDTGFAASVAAPAGGGPIVGCGPLVCDGPLIGGRLVL